MSKQVSNEEALLFADVRQMIEDARKMVSQTVNSGMTLLYWNIGRRINEEVLRNERAEYGKLIVATLSRQLLEDYGSGFSKSSISRMCAFHQEFPDFEIVATLSQQLSWSHFIEIIPLKEPLQREFYCQMCRIEKWDVRALRKKIQSMLFERTAISQKPEELAQLELRARGTSQPDRGDGGALDWEFEQRGVGGVGGVGVRCLYFEAAGFVRNSFASALNHRRIQLT